ncbi:MFS general substrate transporter [Macrolepiota fuliginosa MF-IS2]|uniref:MFS general substrate transporter n=1 Tax=Macrolepiota fuliginosa MF-IS2 TaxID=1400762 RepID=A0A9P5X3U3_9AGAR|nr:MFS general substrate transporter [Macrolepiota fuliginosa MF-IS2]
MPTSTEVTSLPLPREPSSSVLEATPAPQLQNASQPNLSEDTLIDPEELKLPKISSLVIIVVSNLLLQISFFIIVPSSNDYAGHLGGDSTFSGVVIGIPTVFSALALIPLLRYDKGRYALPLNVSCAASIVGHVLYGCAYRANFLYLILIGRIVNGFGFTMWMYSKRYCSDARIVGVRRRTTLASFLVMTQGLGMSLGPFAGGILYKVGFKNSIFNGFTSPAWLMAAVWCCFWVCVRLFYIDIPADATYPDFPNQTSTSLPSPITPTSPSSDEKNDPSKDPDPTSQLTTPPQTKSRFSFLRKYKMSLPQWGVLACMCWFSMTCFFILGAWESNLPVFGSATTQFHWSPTAAGNFIALGGISAFPFLILNVFLIRRIEDRKILALGSCLGLSALLVFLSLLRSGKVNYGSVFMCWWAVALGFNIASTVPVSLLSKQLPPSWNGWLSLAIQYSMYTGRVTGAIWGGSGVKVGMMVYTGFEVVLIGIGMVMFMVLWDSLKAKKG